MACVLAFVTLGGLGRPGEPPRVVIVPLAGELTPGHTALLRRASRAVRERPPALLLIEIDTPGGRSDLMMSLGDEIMKLGVPTAAYVRSLGAGGGAWSAGAYLAFSCKRIYMQPGTVIGAAAPVSPTGEEIPEKYVSAFREKFRARAEQNGYSGNLAAAMVDKDAELFEATVDGKKTYVTAAELDRLRAQKAEIRGAPTLFVPKGKLLTLTDRQVEETGIGRIAADRRAIYSDHRLADPAEEPFAPSWSERLVAFLTSAAVSTALLAIGVLGIWLEIQTPGFGVAGVAGLLSFALLLLGHHLAGLAEAPEILLFVAGVGLVVLEFFVVPLAGLFAAAGIACILGGLILSLQGFAWPEAPWEVDVLLGSAGRVLAGTLAGGAVALVMMRFLPRVPLMRRLVLQAELSPPAAAPQDFVGREGHAATPLRPGGKVRIDGTLLDVVTEGEFVASGEPVRVERIEGPRIVVSRLKR